MRICIKGPTMTPEEAQQHLETVAAQLSEHFEAVQLMVSWPAEGGGGTRKLYRGAGNWFARRGMAHHFIEEDQAEDSAAALSRVIPQPQPPREDGDEWKD